MAKWNVHGAQGTTIDVRFVHTMPGGTTGLDSALTSLRPSVRTEALPSFAVNVEADPDPTDRNGEELVNELVGLLDGLGYVNRAESLGQTIGLSADGGLLSHWVVWVIMTAPVALAKTVKETADATNAVLDVWDRVSGKAVPVGTHEQAERFARAVVTREWSVDGSPLNLELEARSDDGKGRHDFTFVDESWRFSATVVDDGTTFRDRGVSRTPVDSPSAS